MINELTLLTTGTKGVAYRWKGSGEMETDETKGRNVQSKKHPNHLRAKANMFLYVCAKSTTTPMMLIWL